MKQMVCDSLQMTDLCLKLQLCLLRSGMCMVVNFWWCNWNVLHTVYTQKIFSVGGLQKFSLYFTVFKLKNEFRKMKKLYPC